MTGLPAALQAPSTDGWRTRLALAAGVLAAAVLGVATGVATVRAPALLVVTGGVVTVGAAALVRWPTLGVPIAVGLIWSNAAVVAVTVHGAPTVAALGVPLLLVLPLLDQVVRRRQELIVPTAGVCLVAYLVVQLLSSLFAVDRSLALDAVLIFASEGLVLYCLVVNVIRTEASLRQVLWVMLLVGAVLGGISVVQAATDTYDDDYLGFAQNSEVKLEQLALDHFGEHPPPRVAGPIGKKNRYAQILVVLLPLGAVLARSAVRRSARLLAVVATALVVAGLVLTFSRGAAMVLVALVLVMTAMRELRLRHVVIVAVVLVVVALAFPRWGERFSGALAAVDSEQGIQQADGSVRGRVSSALGALVVYSQHPALGVGPGNYPLYHREASSEVGLRIADLRQPHNLYAQVLSEVGTAGGLILAAVSVLSLRGALLARRRHDAPGLRALGTAVLLALLAYFGSAMFLHLAYERYFWLLIALGSSAGVLARRVPPAEVSP